MAVTKQGVFLHFHAHIFSVQSSTPTSIFPVKTRDLYVKNRKHSQMS